MIIPEIAPVGTEIEYITHYGWKPGVVSEWFPNGSMRFRIPNFSYAWTLEANQLEDGVRLPIKHQSTTNKSGCECGAAKCKLPFHSSWCPEYR